MLSLIAIAVAGFQDPTTAQIIEAKFERVRPKLTPIRFISETKVFGKGWQQELTIVFSDTIFKSKTEYKIERHIFQTERDGTTKHTHQVTWCNGEAKPKTWNIIDGKTSTEPLHGRGLTDEYTLGLPGGTQFHATLLGNFGWIDAKAILEEGKEISVKSNPSFGSMNFSATFDQEMFVIKESKSRPSMNRAGSDGWTSTTTHTRLRLPLNIDKAIQFSPPTAKSQ